MTTEIGGLLVEGWRLVGGGEVGSCYDEVLRTVSARASKAKSIDKADVGALVLWKRITAQAKWSRTLMWTPDALVRSATGAAYRLANDPSVATPEAGQAAREALAGLPGMGGTAALASAVLLALAPDRMAVWDRRVGVALSAMRMYPRSGAGFYGRYLSTVVELAQSMDEAATEERAFVPRDVDLALFYIGGQTEMLGKLRTMPGAS